MFGEIGFVLIPRLQSPRLTLRPYKPDDFDAFAALNADVAVRRHVGGPLDGPDAMRLFDRFVTGECVPGHEAWAVIRREAGDYVGHCWFIWRERASCPELGFLIAIPHWRQGYGTEVASTLLYYGLEEAGYPRRIATVDSDHLASIRVLERVGMTRASEERDADGVYFVYSTLPNQSVEGTGARRVTWPGIRES